GRLAPRAGRAPPCPRHRMRGSRGMNATNEGRMARLALRSAAWSERWYPDAWVFAALGVVIVALAALAFGSTPVATMNAFGDGFWSLIPFTMQMAFVVIGGYVVATAPVVARFIDLLARVPKSGRGAICYVALVSMLASLLSWGFSLVFGGLLVRALARRTDLRMDYRAAGAAAYLGLGAIWAMGLSSSAAQLQANPASMPPGLLALTACLIVASLLVCWFTAPTERNARTAEDFGVTEAAAVPELPPRTRPGEWLEYSPLLSVLIGLLGLGWLAHEFATKEAVSAIANLNTYNFLFLTVGLLLHWRPRSFLDAVARAVP